MPSSPDVVFMAELHRLLLFQISAGQIRRSGDLGVRIERDTRQNNRHEHTYPGDVICTFMKELCHFLILSHPKARKIKLRRDPGERVPRQIPANFLNMLVKASVKLVSNFTKSSRIRKLH